MNKNKLGGVPANSGFSIIELMVAVAITAFLMIGLVQIFSSVRASYDLQEGLGRLQENARFATRFMSETLRDTGFFPFPENENPAIDIGFTLSGALTGAVPPPLGANTADGGGTASDTLEANIFDDRDCAGNLNPLSTTGNPRFGWKQVVFNHDATDRELQYSCRFTLNPTTAAPAAVITNQPILNNVENLQFQYGEDLDGDGSADRYVNAGNWAAVGNIVAIRVGLILTSPQLGTLPPDDQTIAMMNTNFPPSGNRELRRPVIFNINLRSLTL